MGRRMKAVLAVALAAILEMGCLVAIERVADPALAFREARREASRAASLKGRPHRVNVLVWEKGEEELVRVSVPLWLARKFEGASAEWDEGEGEGDRGDEVARRVRRHVRLEDLEKAGRGILVEVEEDEGDQVLVWLD